MLQRTYDWMMSFANHPRAVWILAAVSFAESSFFPLPPDPLYMGMLLGNKENTWKLAAICTLSSVIGGCFGYLIGFMFYETLGEWLIEAYAMQESFDSIRGVFDQWGFWFIALKALTPIPYKFVTLACGLIEYNFTYFVIASLIARGSRFFMIAALFWKYGPSMRSYIDENLTFVTTVGLLALISGFVIISYWNQIGQIFQNLF